MCRAITCHTCGLTTWAGCGRHVDQVLAGVPEASRCSCPPDAEPSRAGGGFLARLLGRNR